MQVNNLGGVRGPVTTTTSGTAQTAQTRFSTLMQGGASAPAAGGAAIPGASIISTAVSVTGGSIPGATFGTPYRQAMATAPSTGGTQAPAAGTGTAASADPKATTEQQKALQDLMKMSLMSFASAAFSMGQNRPQMEALED